MHAPSEGLPQPSSVLHEKILWLRFGSPPCGAVPASPGQSSAPLYGLERFRYLMKEGPELRGCREALESAGYSCETPDGLLMFVHPEQVSRVRRALVDVEVRPFQIVVTESFEESVDAVLKTFSFKERPKRKTGEKGRQEICMSSCDPIPILVLMSPHTAMTILRPLSSATRQW